MAATSTTKPVEHFGAPGDAGYRKATAAYNQRVVMNPAGAINAESVADVQDAVREAARNGRKLAVMTTGHGASMLPADLSDLDLIRTDLQTPVRFDPAAATVTFPAGALVQRAAEEAAKHGLAVRHGSSGGVGAVGFLLGGGISFYGRRYGIAANGVVSFRLVTADGEERVVDADSDPDLFWALRGGGGGFGVVTEATWRTIPVSEVVTGLVAWPAASATDVLSAWGEWGRSAPRAITTSLRLLNLPPVPGMPPQLTSGQMITIDGTAVPEDGDVAAAQDAVDAMLTALKAAAGNPAYNTWHRGPQLDALATHMDPSAPAPTVGDGFSIRTWEPDMAAAWIAAGTRAGHQLAFTELRMLGGAFADPSPEGGVFDHIDEAFLAYNVQVLMDPKKLQAVDADVLAVREAMQPWIGRVTPPTFVEMPGEPDRDRSSDLDARVDEVRKRVDPQGVFSADIRPIIAS